MADLSGTSERGSAYGLYHAVIGFLTLPASVMAGVLWQGAGQWSGFGPSAPFLLGALLAGIASLLFIVELRAAGRAAQVALTTRITSPC